MNIRLGVALVTLVLMVGGGCTGEAKKDSCNNLCGLQMKCVGGRCVPGGCATPCGQSASCSSGLCVCDPGYQDCNQDRGQSGGDGCECSGTCSNGQCSGQCTVTCGQNTQCRNDVCRCQSGWLDCNGNIGQPASDGCECKGRCSGGLCATGDDATVPDADDATVPDARVRDDQGVGCGNCGALQCCKNNKCVYGWNDTACGEKGAACVDCTAQSQVCDHIYARCKNAPAPTCKNCSILECCKNNKCVSGISDQSCGSLGSACDDCTAKKLTCAGGGVCKSPCSNICLGCCDAKTKTCVSGMSSSACGTGGVCKDCKALWPPKACVFGTCT